MKVKLYTIPGSHPAMAAMSMLRFKGIAFRRRDLVSVLSRALLRLMGFPRGTVPAMKIDGRRIQGTREISRELERVRPEPPLFPADPEQRAAVEEAERWGDEVLQQPVRETILWSVRKNKSAARSFLEGMKLGIPVSLAAPTVPLVVEMAARVNGATDENVRADVASLGELLQRVDDLITAGTIDGEELNAADFQIAASVRLALTMDDLRPLIESRPAGKFAMRVIPDFPGNIPPSLPPAWLQALRPAPAAS